MPTACRLSQTLDFKETALRVAQFLVRVFAASCICFLSPVTLAQDTQADRERAADRYLRAVPVRKLLTDSFVEMSKQLPLDQRDHFVRVALSVVHIDSLDQISRKSMIKTFNADELNALADFYGSKVGASAMEKFGVYMAEVMPEIEAEIQRGLRDLEATQKR